MRDHEYSIVGHSRTSIGRYLGTVAAVIVSVVTAASVGISNLADAAGLPLWTQTALVVPLSAGVTYWVVHFIFNRYGWKALTWLSQLPDVSGRWDCEGETFDETGNVKFQWKATITISQNWEKIRVNLKSDNSGSNSLTAALVPEPDGAWTLFYSYLNEPKIGEADLQRHTGYAEIQFAAGLKKAEGSYFNGRGRGTFGRMMLTRVNKNG
jgi:hypothetical protein